MVVPGPGSGDVFCPVARSDFVEIQLDERICLRNDSRDQHQGFVEEQVLLSRGPEFTLLEFDSFGRKMLSLRAG